MSAEGGIPTSASARGARGVSRRDLRGAPLPGEEALPFGSHTLVAEVVSRAWIEHPLCVMSVLLQPSGLADPGVKESLRASEERFRLLVETIQDYAIFILDDRGHVATWNPGAERINGYEAREIVGRHFSTFYPPEDVAAGKCDRELEQATALRTRGGASARTARCSGPASS
ncbi:hypothetical protein BE20_02970 [Sorangium cellulosum]|nr:hypothetical protein BE20_02970 [Sorangium cellulosum]